jgi:Mn2+/Fe2+ NRAMP family transporter
VLSIVAAVVLLLGSYRDIEKLLIGLVLLMGLAFVFTFFAVKPSLSGIATGLFVPTIPDGSLLTVIALIGTTVVPYNLFLHASAAKNRWHGEAGLTAARTDTVISIGLGGIIAMLVASTAAASMFANGLSVNSATDMAVQFEPLFGRFSKYLLGIGLFAAGLSSTITAPLATSYALSEILNVSGNKRVWVFRGTSLCILCIGTVLSLAGIKPIELIILAQFANGLLLPVIAGFLIYALNQHSLLGKYTNGWLANIAGICVLVFTAGLGVRLIARSLGLM